MSLRGQQAGSTACTPTLRFLVVTVGGRIVAFDADAVEGVLTLESAEGVKVVTVQGIAYGNIDLVARLALLSDEESSDTRFVLLSHRGRQGNIRVGRVYGLQKVEPSQIIPLPQQFQGVEQTWFRGMVLFQESVALILDTAWVLQDLSIDRDGVDLRWQGEVTPLLAVHSELTMGQAKEC